MFFALIRPAETYTATVEGTDIPVLRAQLVAEAPADWEMVSAHVTMQPGGIRTLEGRFERRDPPTQIEAPDMTAIEAQVPEGWKLLSVWRA